MDYFRRGFETLKARSVFNADSFERNFLSRVDASNAKALVALVDTFIDDLEPPQTPPPQLVLALLYSAAAVNIAGFTVEAEAQLEKLLPISERVRDPYVPAFANLLEGTILQKHGSTEAAERHFERAFSKAEQAGRELDFAFVPLYSFFSKQSVERVSADPTHANESLEIVSSWAKRVNDLLLNPQNNIEAKQYHPIFIDLQLRQIRALMLLSQEGFEVGDDLDFTVSSAVESSRRSRQLAHLATALHYSMAVHYRREEWEDAARVAKEGLKIVGAARAQAAAALPKYIQDLENSFKSWLERFNSDTENRD
jgi:hypothetical protein